MNNKHRKILQAIFANPINGGIDWSLIEALFVAVGCTVIEGKGSSVTFEMNGIKAYFHRPHPGNDALRYRVADARDFLKNIGVTP
jgi:hypothetical protein